MNSQDTEIPSSEVSVLKINFDFYNEPSLFLSELYSPLERKYYHQLKEKLEIQIYSLKNRISELESQNKLKNNFVPKGELFELKYQVIDSFYSQNIQSYIDMFLLYDQIVKENIDLQQNIIYYESMIEDQFKIRKSIIEEHDQLYTLFDFSDFVDFSIPTLTNDKGKNFTRIDISEIDSEDEDNSDSSNDSFLKRKTNKKRIDFLIHKIHEQISWSENRLNVLKNEINKFDMLLDTYHESKKRDAANTITTAQKVFTTKNQISTQGLRITINDLQKLFEDSEKAVNDLEHENEILRQKKVKNALDFSNEKARLKMLRSASLECFKKELSEMKNKVKYLRRSINSKADEYDSNCESLMIVFNEFDKKINGQHETMSNIWKGNKKEESFDKTNDQNIDEEEEEIIEVHYEDQSQSLLLNELEKKKIDLENDIKMIKKQLKRMVLMANKKSNNLLSHIDHLRNKEERNQTQIKAELSKMQKLPQIKSYKYFDKIDATMLKLGQMLEDP